MSGSGGGRGMSRRLGRVRCLLGRRRQTRLLCWCLLYCLLGLCCLVFLGLMMGGGVLVRGLGLVRGVRLLGRIGLLLLGRRRECRGLMGVLLRGLLGVGVVGMWGVLGVDWVLVVIALVIVELGLLGLSCGGRL